MMDTHSEISAFTFSKRFSAREFEVADIRTKDRESDG